MEHPVQAGLFTLIGVIVGALLTYFLTRQIQREQWLKDNRKEEFRELIGALTDAALALIRRRNKRFTLNPCDLLPKNSTIGSWSSLVM